MGRWLEEIRKSTNPLPTKPTKVSSVGFVGNSSHSFQKKEAANDPFTPQQRAWLSAVAAILKIETVQLVTLGFIDSHDLQEHLEADPKRVAALIRSDPRWRMQP